MIRYLQCFFADCWLQTRRYGFLFNDDDEAAVFGKKVMNQAYGGRTLTLLPARAFLMFKFYNQVRLLARKDGSIQADRNLSPTPSSAR